MGIVEILLIAVPCGSAALAFLYGFLRKFSRVTWIGWQILLLFSLTLLLGVIPPMKNGTLWLGLVVGAAFLVILLLFGAEWLARTAILKRNFGKGMRILGRFGGALSAIVAVLALEAVVIGLAFTVIGALPSVPSIFAPVLGSGVWKFFAGHAYDLFVIALFFVFTRAGLRLGLVRAIYYLLMFGFTFACFWGSILLSTKVGFLNGWSNSLASHFSSLLPAAASVVGHGIIAFVCFLILFAVAMLLGALLHWLIRKLLSVRAIGLIDGLLLCIVFAAVFLAFTLGMYYGMAYLVKASGGTGTLARFAKYIGTAVQILRSAPFSRLLYDLNPLISLVGL